MSARIEKRNRLYVASLNLVGFAATVLVVWAFYGLVYCPLDQRQAVHESRAEQLDMLLVQPDSKAVEYNRLRSELNAMQRSVDELHRQLTDDRTREQVIQEVSTLATGSRMQVLDYQIGETQRLATHAKTEVEFRMHGSYDSICRFLDQAEQLAKTTKLSKFELETRNKSGGYPIQLTFVLYSGVESHDTEKKRGVL